MIIIQRNIVAERLNKGSVEMVCHLAEKGLLKQGKSPSIHQMRYGNITKRTSYMY